MPAAQDILALSRTHRGAGRPEQALALLRRALDKHPASQALLAEAIPLLVASGRAEQASFLAERALALAPKDASLWALAARLDEDRAQRARAAERYARACELAPSVAAFREALCDTLNALDREDDSLALTERALRDYPDDPEAIRLCALQRCRVGDNTGAVTLLRDTIRRFPASIPPRLAILMALLREAGVSPAEAFDAHAAVGAMMDRAAPPPRPYTNPRDPERPLRIGYVSQDFRNRSAAHFIEPILEHHDRAAFHVTCYHHTLSEDAMTARLRALAKGWVDIAPLGFEAVAERIRADRIDILVDLSGHAWGGRLRPFTLRPAPVQFTYMGYPATTGLRSIGYRVVDEHTDPPGAERFATERLVRIPGCFLCYKPPPHAGEVTPLPAASGKPFTFGSFNTPLKIGPDVVRVWSGVLAAVPGSRLLIKGESLGSGLRSRLTASFAARGIGPERLDLRGPTPTPAAHLATYAEVDAALDTFPYNGTTTTMEAMWMGVPVVTLEGDCHHSRVGVSLLRNAGLPGCIATSGDGFVRAASRLAGDPGSLAALRAGLRERVRTTVLCDGAGFTRKLEGAYREAWRGWCSAP